MGGNGNYNQQQLFQEIRNAISSSSLWQTAGSWVLLLLPERSGEHFPQPPALQIHISTGELCTCAWGHVQSSISTGLHAEKHYFELK